MSAIPARRFIEEASRAGYGLYVGVPCSYLGALIDEVLATPSLRYVAAANEGDAVAIASGAELGGQRAVVLLQNSGLGNAVNPLSSLNRVADIPVLLMISWRGEPTGAADEPQHALMGAITTPLLDLLGIGWELLPSEDAQLGPVLERAAATMRAQRRPFALIVRKGVFAERAPQPRSPAGVASARHPRRAYLAVVQETSTPEDVLVATTGYTGRELESLADRPNQLYLVGAMGCASSVGLGLAWAQPRRRVIVLDGDGALLMRLSALTTIGAARPPNLLHIVFDNEAYESTGGQANAARTVDLGAMATACGYPQVHAVSAPDELARIVAQPAAGLTLVHIKTDLLDRPRLPRPARGPVEVAERLRRWLASAGGEPRT